MDKMGLMGWIGRNIKSVLQFSLYFVGISIMYIYTYIYSQSCPHTAFFLRKVVIEVPLSTVMTGGGGVSETLLT